MSFIQIIIMMFVFILLLFILFIGFLIIKNLPKKAIYPSIIAILLSFVLMIPAVIYCNKIMKEIKMKQEIKISEKEQKERKQNLKKDFKDLKEEKKYFEKSKEFEKEKQEFEEEKQEFEKEKQEEEQKKEREEFEVSEREKLDNEKEKLKHEIELERESLQNEMEIEKESLKKEKQEFEANYKLAKTELDNEKEKLKQEIELEKERLQNERKIEKERQETERKLEKLRKEHEIELKEKEKENEIKISAYKKQIDLLKASQEQITNFQEILEVSLLRMELNTTKVELETVTDWKEATNPVGLFDCYYTEQILIAKTYNVIPKFGMDLNKIKIKKISDNKIQICGIEPKFIGFEEISDNIVLANKLKYKYNKNKTPINGEIENDKDSIIEVGDKEKDFDKRCKESLKDIKSGDFKFIGDLVVSLGKNYIKMTLAVTGYLIEFVEEEYDENFEYMKDFINNEIKLYNQQKEMINTEYEKQKKEIDAKYNKQEEELKMIKLNIIGPQEKPNNLGK